MAEPTPTDPEQTDPEQTDPEQTDPEQTDPEQTDPEQTDPEQTDPGRRVTSFGNDGLTFDVLDQGPVDGEPIVLLHGFPERATCWRLVAPLLHAAGYRTLALDQRGYSPGARPPRRRDYLLPALAGDVVALIDRVTGPGGSAHVVGHDWGAAAAWTVAGLHPDRVRTLTAVSVPHPRAFIAAARHSGQLLRSWYMLMFQLPVVPELVIGRSRSDRMLRSFGMTAADVARFRDEIVDDGALPTALNWYRALPLSDPRGGAGRIEVPTTMIWSDGDTAIARWGAAHSGSWVDADFNFVELAGVSHWIPTQAAEACAEAVLERVGG
ncbi:alpha/beta fold hydrolase [Nocardioides sambongensis]|uniref:alpha/beta fold hydrolase n=1 Tax=Nocardioides sambongensis TaxID=2589074 RepID=UPI001E2F9D3F|nr:alpha/beta fold hydrolase [Nocardioides sambongensis]